MKKLLISLILPCALLCGCGDGNKFSVSGKIENAKDEILILERPVSGMWLRIDSIKTDGNGEFSFSEEAPKYPEIFRLARKGKYIYFPIDSIDNIKITTDTASFGVRYALSGSDDAVRMMQVDSISRELAKLPAGSPELSKAKGGFANMILQDPSSIVAYYIVNKVIGTTPLYSIDNKEDVRIIGAVANAYNSYKPNDPRTELLKQMFFTGRRNTVVRTTAAKDTFYVDQAQIIDINLFDRNGKSHKLSDAASKGKVVILNFTTYLADESPALNAQLASLYRKYAGSGLEIYQVGYDENEFSWKEAAKNLPWITVYDPSGAQSQYLMRYNVGSIPAIFIINRQGELSERVTNLGSLEKTVAKYM